MKVLFITNMYPTPHHPTDGIFVREQIENLSKNRHFEYDVYHIDTRVRGKLGYLKSLLILPFRIFSCHYDLIHIHYGISGLFLLFWRPPVTVFLTLHGGEILPDQGHFVQAFLTKRILSKVNKVFIQSKEMQEIVELHTNSHQILPCGVDSTFFRPLKVSDRSAGRKLIIFPSDPARPEKNFALFFSTVKLLRKIALHQIEYRCIYNLSREEVRDLYNEADCLLMTSISEGSPQVVKEALFSGLPVVSVPVGDVREMVDGIPNCFISDEYCPLHLSRLVQLAYTCKSDDIRKAFLCKGYDLTKVTDQLLDNYLQVKNDEQ